MSPNIPFSARQSAWNRGPSLYDSSPTHWLEQIEAMAPTNGCVGMHFQCIYPPHLNNHILQTYSPLCEVWSQDKVMNPVRSVTMDIHQVAVHLHMNIALYWSSSECSPKFSTSSPSEYSFLLLLCIRTDSRRFEHIVPNGRRFPSSAVHCYLGGDRTRLTSLTDANLRSFTTGWFTQYGSALFLTFKHSQLLSVEYDTF